MLDVMRSNAKSSLIALIFGAIILTFIFSFDRGSSAPHPHAENLGGEGEQRPGHRRSHFRAGVLEPLPADAQMRGGKYTVDNARQDNLARGELRSLVDQELIAQQPSIWGSG